MTLYESGLQLPIVPLLQILIENAGVVFVLGCLFAKSTWSH